MGSSDIQLYSDKTLDMDKVLNDVVLFLREERELREKSDKQRDLLHREVLEIKSDLRVIMGSVSIEKMDKRDDKMRDIELQQEVLKGIINNMDAHQKDTSRDISDIQESIDRINERMSNMEIVKRLSESEITNIKSREEKRDKLQKELMSKVSDILIKMAGLGAAGYLGFKEIVN